MSGPSGATTTTAHNKELNPWMEGHIRRLGHDGTVLDLGCGRGFWLEWMAAEGITAIGFEHDFDRVRLGAAHAPVAVADGQKLPLRDGAVSVVWCIHVLHHLPQPEAVLSEIRRVLRPGGHLVLAETVEDNPVVRYGRKLWPHWDGVDIEAKFTASQLVEMLADAGLSVVDRRQHSLLSFAAWSLPEARRRMWVGLSRLEARLPRRFDRWGAHLECVARS